MNIQLNSLIAMVALASISAIAEVKRPDFLPAYFTPAFSINGTEQAYKHHSLSNGVHRWSYAAEDMTSGAVLEWIPCDTVQSETVFNNVLGYLSENGSKGKGHVYDYDEYNACVQIDNDASTLRYYVYRLPEGVRIWTYSVPLTTVLPEDHYKSVCRLENRRRYEVALQLGNVDMGKWENAIYAYALSLLEDGKKDQAVKVLKDLILTSPYHYDAHISFMQNSRDLKAVTNSAHIVGVNAEDERQIIDGEKVLGQTHRSLNSLPYLEKNETGLQLILIPLAPCSLRVLDEASVIYQEMMDIPVSICRMKEDWAWDKPERFGGQRAMERLLTQMKQEKTDFRGWTREKFIQELRTNSKKLGPWYEWYADDLILETADDLGQFDVSNYIGRFCSIIDRYRSADKRTMYVGVTEANLFTEKNNYVFSQGRTSGKSLGSILSYHMMQAEALNEDYAYRPRLVERLAKELVPASLKSLGIPRSSDPRCPYSYSSGVGRLDEKTLQLSQPAREGLDAFRE